MGPFLGLVESVPILKGPKKGPKSGPAFGPAFHTSWLSSELFNLEIRNKTAENKSLGKVMTSHAELQQAAVADEQVGNNGNKNCVAVHLLHQRLKRVLWHCGDPLSMACFRAVFKLERAGIKGCKNTLAHNMKTWKQSFARVQTPESLCVEAVSFFTFSTPVSEPTNLDAADCCGCQSTLLQLHRRGNLPRTKYEAACLPVSQAFAGVSTS